ncbi:MAG TPA: histidinol dehydrogenase [Solirubrobacterales bacterium]|nr:histidinol dehydrogenase [Solirubrobacterales bacterium]
MRVERREWDGAGATALAAEIRDARPRPQEVAGAAAGIVAEVARGGDAALRELARRLNSVEHAPESFRVDPRQIAAAPDAIDPPVLEAMQVAAGNIRALAEAELRACSPVDVELSEGQRVRQVDTPVGSAGAYAPGGRAAYPSTVLMCCVPARVAGVSRVAVASPPGPDGGVHASVLAACSVAGVDEVYAVGGAQAIAALVLGTESVTPVDVVVGPGNRYVVEAKRLLSDRVGIDSIAGPSELVVVADGSAEPRRLALDLCAQAEHGPDGLLVAISTDGELLDELGTLLAALAQERPSVSDVPVTLVASPGADRALQLADALAPEHLELQLSDVPEDVAGARVAGCVFVGVGGGAAFGDYAAGSNHVLPTGGAARVGRPLGPDTFLRRTAVVDVGAPAAAALAPAVDALARAEGFPVHGESATARAGQNGGER